MLNNRERIALAAVCVTWSKYPDNLRLDSLEYLGITPNTLGSLFRKLYVLEVVGLGRNADKKMTYAYRPQFSEFALHYSHNWPKSLQDWLKTNCMMLSVMGD